LNILNTIESFNEYISSEKPVSVLFSSYDCNTCTAIKEKLKKEYSDIEYSIVYLDDIPSLKGELCIFSVPTICIYVESKEYERFSRYFSISDIQLSVRRIKDILEK